MTLSPSAKKVGPRASASCTSWAAPPSTWGDRAISQTKMTISQRATVEQVEVDALCTGALRLPREAPWALGHRAAPAHLREGPHGPSDAGRGPEVDRTLLEAFPVGYRHLAYLQTRIGYTVKKDMPGLEGAGGRGAVRPRGHLAEGKPL